LYAKRGAHALEHFEGVGNAGGGIHFVIDDVDPDDDDYDDGGSSQTK